ncbi:MAG: aspartyl protease [Chloroflexi bacterium]|nr:MAG: aspartyl protease [Chloroflexota bacterium]
MGHVRVTIRIAHPARREEPVEVPNALVDTGATWTTVPRQLADRLGLEVIEQLPAQTAAGEVTVDHSFAVVEYDGRRSFADILISDAYPGVLVGVVTLEGLRLAVDPGTGRLVDAKLLLL